MKIAKRLMRPTVEIPTAAIKRLRKDCEPPPETVRDLEKAAAAAKEGEERFGPDALERAREWARRKRGQ